MAAALTLASTPRKIWLRMTPEFPLAPISMPLARVFVITARSLEPLFLTSDMPLVNVRDMFVPVSPSGTGNTFRELTSSWRLLRLAQPLSSIPRNTDPFNLSILFNAFHHSITCTPCTKTLTALISSERDFSSTYLTFFCASCTTSEILTPKLTMI